MVYLTKSFTCVIVSGGVLKLGFSPFLKMLRLGELRVCSESAVFLTFWRHVLYLMNIFSNVSAQSEQYKLILTLKMLFLRSTFTTGRVHYGQLMLHYALNKTNKQSLYF